MYDDIDIIEAFLKRTMNEKEEFNFTRELSINEELRNLFISYGKEYYNELDDKGKLLFNTVAANNKEDLELNENLEIEMLASSIEEQVELPHDSNYQQQKISLQKTLESSHTIHKNISEPQDEKNGNLPEIAFNKSYSEGVLNDLKESSKVVTIKSNKFLKIVASIAAIFIIVITGYFIFFQPKDSAQQITDKYIKENYLTLPEELDDVSHSLQLGIDAYKKDDFNKAARLFEDVYKNNPEILRALEYEGLAYLRMNDYGNALHAFDELANIDSLHSNPGKFLKAITLMRRNKNDDLATAKLLLQEIVSKNLEGSKNAEEWMKVL